MDPRKISLTIAVLLAACFFSASAEGQQLPSVPSTPLATAVSSGGVAISVPSCDKRVNDTIEKLLQCIRRDALWNRLAHFQVIADENPDRQGHGNRDTGTPGYLASVYYVAALMEKAGYQVAIQSYAYRYDEVVGVPQFSEPDRVYSQQEWDVARLSGPGTLTAPVRPASGSGTGCGAEEFAGFVRGSVALLERGACAYDTQVENAANAGASAVILYNQHEQSSGGRESAPANRSGDGRAFQARLTRPAPIPVVGMASNSLGEDLLRRYMGGEAPLVHLDIETRQKTGTDYNLIADSPYGDPKRVVVVDAHLDSIFGAGMLDNASGSTTNIEIALAMAKTPTRNHLRYIWFGGEEIGLFGSAYYSTHLTPAELHRIVFDIDVDVTATPNFDYLVADPTYASNVNQFPKQVVPKSKVGNELFAEFFAASGVPSLPASFGNDGTDSNSFSLVGVPNSGILTQQDCCKAQWEVGIWGGYLGNYEGKIPSFNGGCVDYPGRWCDNLSNNDPEVLELASKAVAYVTFNLANHKFAP